MLIAFCGNEKTFLDEIKVLIHKRYFNNDKLKISEFTNGEDFLKISLSELLELIAAEKVSSTDSPITMTFMVSNQ